MMYNIFDINATEVKTNIPCKKVRTNASHYPDLPRADVEGVTLVLPSRLFMLNKYWRILALS